MKINKKGFVLAETLVVTVFVMLIFTIIYANFYPILGKYQEREYFDDIDSKYDTYWLKRFFQDPNIIEDEEWNIIKKHVSKFGGFEFYCSRNKETATQISMNCPFVNDTYYNLVVGFMETTNCQHVYITKYNLEASNHINGEDGASVTQFKGNATNTYTKKFVNQSNVNAVNNDKSASNKATTSTVVEPSIIYYHIHSAISKTTMRYIDYLPAYKFPSTRGAKYRIIAEYARTEDEGKANDKKIHTFATIELKRD